MLEMYLPNITLPSEANTREHYQVKSNRHKKIKRDILNGFLTYTTPAQSIILANLKNALANNDNAPSGQETIKFPISITLTRIAPRSLDPHDNLPMSLKTAIDIVASYLLPHLAAGRADNDNRIKWHTAQEKGIPKQYGLKIKIEEYNG